MYLLVLKVNNNVLNENSILTGKNMGSIGRYMPMCVQAMHGYKMSTLCSYCKSINHYGLLLYIKLDSPFHGLLG